MDCKEPYIQFIEAIFTNSINSPSPQGPIPVLVRKQVGNPPNYFDKSFREYQEGFSANGIREGVKKSGYSTVRLTVRGRGGSATSALTVSKCENFDPFLQ